MIATQELDTSTKHYEKLIDILGRKYIRSKIESPFDFITIARKGVNVQIINNFKGHFDLSLDFIAKLLNVSEPTIYRWVRDDKTLKANHSVQLFELTDLFLYGTEVFENKDNFFKWLALPNTVLGGLESKGLLEVPGGISKVKDLLGRIEYGVYS